MSPEAREVALARVASSPHSEAFTGADLQALVDTAQLDAIHCYLEVRLPHDAVVGRSISDADRGLRLQGRGGRMLRSRKRPECQ